MSSSTGAGTTTSAAARTAPCTPTTRWARCCGAARGRRARTRGTSGRCATSCRWCASTSASRRREGGPPRAAPPRARGPRRRRADALLTRRLRVATGGLADGAVGGPSRGGRAPRGAARARGAPPDLRPRLLQEPREAPLAGLVLRGAGGPRPLEGDLAGRGRRPQRPRARELDGLQGRLADGARLCGGVRADRRRAVDLAPAVRALRPPVRPPALAAPAPRPARAAGVLGLVRLLQRLADRRLGAARVSAPGLPAGPDARDRAGAARGLRRCRAADGAARLARDRRRLRARLPLRAQRRRIERDRRRLRERDRRRPLRLRPAGLWPLPARQPARRHLRPGHLLRLRPVRA